MKTKKAHFLTAVLVLPLLFLVVGCDAGGGVIADDLTQEVAYKIDCFVPEGTTQMVFEARGAIEDAGTIQGEPLPLDDGSSSWVVYRQLKGQKGQMALRVENDAVPYGSHVAEGTFTVLGSSGAYTSLQRKGTFYATLDEAGELIEVFEGYTSVDQ